MQVFLLRVQVYETLQIMLQVGRAHARNGDTVAVAELKHRVAMHVRSNRGRQFLHIMNIGELIELYRVVLWIEVVDRLRTPARVEYKGVVADTADGDRGRIGTGSGRRVEDNRAAMPVRCLFQIAEVEIIYGDHPKVLYCDDSVAVSVFRKADVASRYATQIDFIGGCREIAIALFGRRSMGGAARRRRTARCRGAPAESRRVGDGHSHGERPVADSVVRACL